MFDKNQSRAIRHLDGPALTIAGPGAGKTHVLIQRIIHMVRTAKIKPQEILVITFTRAAAQQMDRRYKKNVDTTEYGVSFGTFHSVYYSILQENRLSEAPELIDENTKKYLIHKSANMCGVNLESIPEGYVKILKGISSLKNNSKTADEFIFNEITQSQFSEIVRLYDKSKKELSRIDFDDMLVDTYDMLLSRKDILDKYRKRFRYILVDEAQDMNRIQFDVLRLIAEPTNNIFLVGDDDQSIYSFRGADSDIMLSFKEYYPEGKLIVLDKNFRSQKGIIDASSKVISHNSHRFEKKYIAINTGKAKIRYMDFADEKEEAEVLSKLIKKENEDNSGETIGILYRNHRQGFNLKDCFEKMDFDYFGRVIDDTLSLQYPADVIRDYFYLSVFGPKREVVLRVMNTPERFLPRSGLLNETVSFKKWMDYHRDDVFTVRMIKSFYADILRVSNLSSFGAICYITRKIGLDKYAADKKIGGYQNSVEKLLELAKKYPDKKNFLENVLKDNNNKNKHTVNNSKVYFYTFHGSKGLEFDHVYIIDANEDITPSRFAKTMAEIEEERRMFYVAMTRAKSKLTISCTKKTDKKDSYPSRFVREISSEVTHPKDC